MRTGRMNTRALFTAALLVSGALWMGGVSPTGSEAGEDEEVQLLVKCSKGDVESIVAFVEARKASVWDMKTMQRLSVPVVSGKVPPLLDAAKLMEELIAVVDAFGTESNGTPITIESMTIQQRRASFKILFSEADTVDRVRKALQSNARIRALAKDASRPVETGRAATAEGRRVRHQLHDAVQGADHDTCRGQRLPGPLARRLQQSGESPQDAADLLGPHAQ